LRTPEHALLVARKIVRDMSIPFQLDGLEHQVSVSIGIALYPNHGKNTDALLRYADTAMYRSKRRNKRDPEDGISI